MAEPTSPPILENAGIPAGPPRILLVSDYLPMDVAVSVHGAFQRLRRHVEILQTIGDLDVVFLWPWHPDAWNKEAKANLAALRDLWRLRGRVELVFSHFTGQRPDFGVLLLTWLERWFARTNGTGNAATIRAIAAVADSNPPDLIFAHRLGAILPMIRGQAGKHPIVIDLDDVEHVRMRRHARARPWRERPGLLLDAWLTKQLESEALAGATTALVCSQADARLLRRSGSKGTIAILPNAAAEQDVLPASTGPVALFVGMVRYGPNAQGLIWLARDVWPLVRRALPAARLIVAGLGSDELDLADDVTGVETLGFVTDLKPLYAAARIAVCPLHIASGTRIKIIEAAMFGRPTVSTTVGAEGLAFAAGREIALADGAAAFAEACVALLRDEPRAREMGLAARETARRLYSPAAITAQLKMLCARALGAANS